MSQLSKDYDQLELEEKLKPMPKSVDDFGHKKEEDPKKPRRKTMKELEDEWTAKNVPDEDDDDAPDLEEVD